jgi:hypothetical protein
MLSVYIFLVIAIALIWIFIKMRHVKHRSYAIFIILILLFFLVTGTKVVNDNKIDVSTFKGFLNAGKMYFVWLFQLGGNAKALVGSAINMNWGNVTG